MFSSVDLHGTHLRDSSSRSPTKQHPLANSFSRSWIPAVATTSARRHHHPRCLPTRLPTMPLQTHIKDHILMRGNTRAIMVRIITPHKDTEELLPLNRLTVPFLANKELFHPATRQIILPVALLQIPAWDLHKIPDRDCRALKGITILQPHLRGTPLLYLIIIMALRPSLLPRYLYRRNRVSNNFICPRAALCLHFLVPCLKVWFQNQPMDLWTRMCHKEEEGHYFVWSVRVITWVVLYLPVCASWQNNHRIDPWKHTMFWSEWSCP